MKDLFVAMPSNGGNILCLPSLEIFAKYLFDDSNTLLRSIYKIPMPAFINSVRASLVMGTIANTGTCNAI